ncbi:MAG: hypothetical protein M0036_00125 [Desulfobacteraceae bacterium]|nr:hypothetical protein [Desulfobacteraceae bacterium]
MQANQATYNTARALSQKIRQAFEQKGIKIGVTIRPWAADSIDPLKALPKTSLQLGIVSPYQDLPEGSRELIEELVGNIVFSERRVVVCEIQQTFS